MKVKGNMVTLDGNETAAHVAYADAPDFVKNMLGPMMVLEGDSPPVSALSEDGNFPSGTTQYTKRNIAIEIPSWVPPPCTQCGRCSLVCPHAAIRAKIYDPKILKEALPTFKSAEAKWKNFQDSKYKIQIGPEDCTGCGLCAHNSPVKAKKESMARPLTIVTQIDVREPERDNRNFFLGIPEIDRSKINIATVKDVQLLRPLFEFSGVCAAVEKRPTSNSSQLYSEEEP